MPITRCRSSWPFVCLELSARLRRRVVQEWKEIENEQLPMKIDL
jgi:hypothetical protein